MMVVLVDGLMVGTQLALLALGMTLVFGLAGVLNLAYGQMVVVTAVAIDLLLGAGVPMITAVIAGVAVGATLGWAFDVSVLRPLRSHEGEHRVVLGLLLTLAVAFVLDGLLVWSVPYTALSLAVGWPAIDMLGVRVRAGSLLAIGVAAATLLVGWALLSATHVGRQIRAVRANEDGARMTGIDVQRMRLVVMVASGSIAAVVAVTRGLSASVGASDGFDLTVMALVVAVVGGLGRVGGAWLAGLLLGVAYAAMTAWVGSAATTVVMLLAAAVAILVRGAHLEGVARR